MFKEVQLAILVMTALLCPTVLAQEIMAKSSGSHGPYADRAPIVNPTCATAIDTETLQACLKKPNTFQAQLPSFVRVETGSLPNSPPKGDIDTLTKAVEEQLGACRRKRQSNGKLAADSTFGIRIRTADSVESRLIFREKWCVDSNTKLLDLIHEARARYPFSSPFPKELSIIGPKVNRKFSLCPG